MFSTTALKPPTILLKEISKGFTGAKDSLFWKIWPGYIRFVCPLLIILMFVQNVRS